MKQSHIDSITTLLNIGEHQLINKTSYLYIHSILNMYDFDYLLNIVLNTNNHIFYSILNKNITTRLLYEKEPVCIYEKLKENLSSADYNKRQVIRKYVFILLENLDIHYKADAFNVFFNSNYKNDIKAATKLITCRLFEKHELLIINKYYEFPFSKLLDKYLKYSSLSSIEENIYRIWDTQPLDYQKMRIIRDINQGSNKLLEIFDFIKHTEPEKYLYAMAISSEECKQDKQFLELVNNAYTKHRGYCLMSLGLLKKKMIVQSNVEEFILENMNHPQSIRN